MKRLLLTTLLAGFTVAASAQGGVGVMVQPTVQDDIHPDIATRDVRDHHCLRETGSLVATARNQRALRRARAQKDATVEVECADHGRAYTRDDIRRTGAVNMADVIRQLDPSAF